MTDPHLPYGATSPQTPPGQTTHSHGQPDGEPSNQPHDNVYGQPYQYADHQTLDHNRTAYHQPQQHAQQYYVTPVGAYPPGSPSPSSESYPAPTPQAAPVPGYAPSPYSGQVPASPQMSYPSHYPPAAPTHTQGTFPPAVPLDSSATPNEGKKRLGLIITILILVGALVTAGVLLLPRLLSGNSAAASDHYVIPSDGWVNGAERVWDIPLNRSEYFTANANYIVTFERDLPDTKLRGFKLHGADEPEEIWTTTVDFALVENFTWHGDTLYAQSSPIDGERTLVSIDVATGNILDAPIGERESTNSTVLIYLMDSHYVQCEFKPEQSYGSYILFKEEMLAGFAPFLNAHFSDLDYCAGKSYSNSEVWRLDSHDFPNDKELVTIDFTSGDLSIVRGALDFSGSASSRPVLLPYDNMQIIALAQHNFIDTTDKMRLWTSRGEEIGTIDAKLGNISPAFVRTWVTTMSESQAREWVERGKVNLSEEVAEGGYITVDKIFYSNGQSVKDFDNSGRNITRFVSSPNGSVSVAYTAFGIAGLHNGEKDLLPFMGPGTGKHLVRPDLLLQTQRFDKQAIVGFAPQR